MATMNESAQLVQSCTECEHRIGLALTPPMAHFDKTTIRAIPVGAPKVAENVVPIGVTPRTPRAAAGATVAPTGDVMTIVRDRLTFLEAEIAHRAGLEVEAKKLRKMLAAADRSTKV
jgi:hypothetical protein